jgi:hypothetical protein
MPTQLKPVGSWPVSPQGRSVSDPEGQDKNPAPPLKRAADAALQISEQLDQSAFAPASVMMSCVTARSRPAQWRWSASSMRWARLAACCARGFGDDGSCQPPRAMTICRSRAASASRQFFKTNDELQQTVAEEVLCSQAGFILRSHFPLGE